MRLLQILLKLIKLCPEAWLAVLRLTKKEVNNGKHQVAHCHNELHSLLHKLWPHQFVIAETSFAQVLAHVTAAIASCRAEREKQEAADTEARLQIWRQKFVNQDIKIMSQWMRQKEAQQRCVTVTHHGQSARSDNQAAEFIHEFWSQLWTEQAQRTERLGVNAESIARTLAHHFPRQHFAHQWEPPICWEVIAAAQKCQGAAGCDSWTAVEVHALPKESLHIFHTLALRWCVAEKIPRALTQGRIVNIPKMHKLTDTGCVATSDLRPITVLSIWWRVWAASWCLSRNCKTWVEALPESLCGLSQHAGAEEAAAKLQDSVIESQGHLVTLDYYSACYDRMSGTASADFLAQIGLPKALTEHIRQAWYTERWIQYGDHTHPRTIQHSAVPQGCPLAPLTLACWMLAGQHSVKSQLVQAGFSPEAVDAHPFLSYMDDRTWIGTNLQQSTACVSAWTHFSDSVSLKENQNKTMACAKTKRGQAQLKEEHPEWCREANFPVLGTCMTTGPRRNTAKETGRLQSSVKRTQLIKVLPVPYSAGLTVFRKLALPVASFGWGYRMPPKADCNSLFNTLTAVLGRNKMASPFDPLCDLWRYCSSSTSFAAALVCSFVQTSQEQPRVQVGQAAWHAGCHTPCFFKG